MPAIRILTLTTLFPNAANRQHGVFVENRLRHLRMRHDVEMTVIAPVPFFPFRSDLFMPYARFARSPREEMRHGVKVYHPRYLLPPKVGMTFAAYSLAFSFEREVNRLRKEGKEFDVVDAHYYYPDGVAAAKVAEKLDLPLVITARGTDINFIPDYARQHSMILEASAIARQSVTVCDALREEMINLGAAGEKIRTLRNGVDLDTFRPLDRQQIRLEKGLSGTVFLSVGHLIERKGHDLAIRLLQDFEDAQLLIVGDGPEKTSLNSLARELGVERRVSFLGKQEHEALPDIYNSADLFILGSSREGWPNVLLEAMACGTPCVAADIWGNSEVIRDKRIGRIASERTVGSFTQEITDLLEDMPPRETVRAYAEQFSWDDTSDALMQIFKEVIRK